MILMPPRLPALVLALVLGSASVACGAESFQRGRELYSDGRYVEAAEVFERNEEGVEGASLSERAEYGLYRGATFYALGDFEHAQRWLSLSYDLSRSNPDVLSDDQQRFLARTLTACSHRLAAMPPPAREQNTKVASTEHKPGDAPEQPAPPSDPKPVGP
jgi:tetratricopeptide (TPR) repeat protein